MPYLEITIPRIDDETRTILSEKLTDAFVEASGFPKEIFGIRFDEYEYGEVASGGKMITQDDGRPNLHFQLFCPRINRTKKQNVVRSLTEAFVECIGKQDWKPVIHISEHSYDNVGVDGKLLSDAYPELSEKKFYYPLQDE